MINIETLDSMFTDALQMKRQAIVENDTETLEFFEELENEIDEIIELGERLIKKTKG